MPANNKLLAMMSDKDREILGEVELVFLNKGDVLGRLDQPLSHWVFLERGLVCTMRTVDFDRTVATGTVGANGLVGASTLFLADESVVDYLVMIPGEGYRVSRARLHDAIQRSPSLHRLFQRFGQMSNKINHHNTVCSHLHSAYQRECRLLLAASAAARSDDVALSHGELAMMLGVSRNAANTAVRQLKQAGLIEQTERSHIKLLDKAALADAACECHALIIDWFDRVFAGK